MKSAMAWLGKPTVLKAFHGYTTVVWGFLIPISLLTPLKDSVPWIVLMSVWANFASHFAAWQASRTEVSLDNDTTAVRSVDAN